MTRWLLGTVAVTVGATGFAAAQFPPRPTPAVPARSPATRAAEPEDVVLLMRTTGQPDRKLKVVKRSTFDDGESLVDVQDLATGQAFTLPGKMADRMPRAGAAAQRPEAAPTPVVQPAPVPASPKPPAVSGAHAPVPPPPVAAPAPVTASDAVVWKPIAPDPTLAPKPAASRLVPVPSPTAVPASVPAPAPASVLVPSPTAPVHSTDRWKPIPPPIPVPMPPTPSPTPRPSDDDAITVRGQMPSSLGGRPTAFRRPGEALPKPPPLTDAMGALPPTQDKLLPGALPKLFVPAAAFPASPPVASAPLPASRPAMPSLPASAVAATLPAPQPAKAIPSSFSTPAPHLSTDAPVWRPSRAGVAAAPPAAPSPPSSVAANRPSFAPSMPVEALPSAPAAETPAVPTFVPAVSPPATPGSARITVPAVEEPDPASQPAGDRRANWTPMPPSVSLERKGPEVELRRAVLEEIRSLETTLTDAVRPSERMAAAANLAETRYAARPEVKAVLARAAMADPSLPVRVECVRALTQLGYADTEYVAFLRASTSSSTEENLRLAATDALRQIRPKE